MQMFFKYRTVSAKQFVDLILLNFLTSSFLFKSSSFRTTFYKDERNLIKTFLIAAFFERNAATKKGGNN